MAKVYVDCADPNDLASLEASFEQLQGKCDITYFRQAKGLMETGLVDSRRAAERHIAQETGETPSAVHARVQRGQKKLVHGEPPSSTPPPSDEIQENQDSEPSHGGKREGSGRPPKFSPPENDPLAAVIPIHSDAMNFSWLAISQLKRIRLDDPRREEALDEVEGWINQNRRK